MTGSRRRPNAAEARTIVHKVRVNEVEEAALNDCAAKQGVTVARLLVESALSDSSGETRTERENALSLYFRLERLLGNVANNINQIAKVANTTGSVDVTELRSYVAEARAIYVKLDALIDRNGL